ncbi:malectin domain-containing carbohydrate-binding protein [Thermopirellula anaerolimosa]
MMRFTSWVGLLVCVAGIVPALLRPRTLQASQPSSPAAIVVRADADAVERLAAQEVRRYVYQRTGALLPIVADVPGESDVILIAYAKALETGPWLREMGLEDSLTQLAGRLAVAQPDGYVLWTVPRGERHLLVVAGYDAGTLLYAAYRTAESYGARFYLDGDVLPDRLIAWSLPQLDETRRPLFACRGIQPFHDFPEGPDWWSLEDYRAVLAQLPKLGMNFFGLHCYPEGGVGPEPLVWIGTTDDIGEGPAVRFSYPARHFLTGNVTGAWGYRPWKTSAYVWGADRIFEADDFGADYMQGYSPWNEAPVEKTNQLFEAMGVTLDGAFRFARLLGVKTVVGTETPLTIPSAVRKRLEEAGKDPRDPAVVQEVYEGMFRRIMQTHPLDYYWFWTPEDWTWSGTKPAQIDATLADLNAAAEAARKVGAPFGLATCGWVLGPVQDRAMFDKVLPKDWAVSCINRQVGHEPVEPGFAQVEGRPKWAIPWMEDDPALNSPQLWVGRMRKDAADALAYGCTGLMGIHWRTRQLGPNVSALAKAAWDQAAWNPNWGRPPQPKPAPKEGPQGGNWAAFPGAEVADTEEDELYRTVRYNVAAYHFDVPNGRYRLILKFCEPHYAEAGKRVFGVRIQGQPVIEGLDIFARVGRNRALDYTFEDVAVTDGRLTIDFVPEVEYPSIAAIRLEGPMMRAVNCGGPAWQDYAADWPVTNAAADRFLASHDFYLDWAAAQFGPEVAAEIAEIFAAVDGRLPRPSNWVGGPGGIQPDPRPWEKVAPEYAFVSQLEALRDRVVGPGNLERFDYWLNLFRYMRANGQVNCTWAVYNAAVAKAKQAPTPEEQRRVAREEALPLRIQLVRETAQAHHYLLAHVSTYGGLGNVANWQQHVLPMLLYDPGAELEQMLGEPLPPEAQPGTDYEGPPRLIVPTQRTLLTAGEAFRVKVIVLGFTPDRPVLRWRPLGDKEFRDVPLEHDARGVYRATIGADILTGDFEYYVEAQTGGVARLRYPAAAPGVNLSVVVLRP